MTQKIFVLNVITSYVPLFLTAFVYVPFASYIVPHLDVFHIITMPVMTDEKHRAPPAPGAFQINPDRLRKQVIYFTVTAQVVGLALELIVPTVKRKVFKKAKEMQSSRKDVNNKGAAGDKEEERKFLESVRDQAELDVYDVNADLREMTTQVSPCPNFHSGRKIANEVLVWLSRPLLPYLAPHSSVLHRKQLDRTAL